MQIINLTTLKEYTAKEYFKYFFFFLLKQIWNKTISVCLTVFLGFKIFKNLQPCANGEENLFKGKFIATLFSCEHKIVLILFDTWMECRRCQNLNFFLFAAIFTIQITDDNKSEARTKTKQKMPQPAQRLLFWILLLSKPQWLCSLFLKQKGALLTTLFQLKTYTRFLSRSLFLYTIPIERACLSLFSHMETGKKSTMHSMLEPIEQVLKRVKQLDMTVI